MIPQHYSTRTNELFLMNEFLRQLPCYLLEFATMLYHHRLIQVVCTDKPYNRASSCVRWDGRNNVDFCSTRFCAHCVTLMEKRTIIAHPHTVRLPDDHPILAHPISSPRNGCEYVRQTVGIEENMLNK